MLRNNERRKEILTMNNYHEEIREVFYTLVIGEIALCKGFDLHGVQGRGMQVFLDNLKKATPEIFKDKQFILKLIYGLPELEGMNASYGDILERFYREYLDGELQSDKDIFYSFSIVDKFGYEYPDYLKYGNDEAWIPDYFLVCPHELAMDENMFSMLLRKTDPVSIYSSILTDEEKLDDTIIRRLLRWYKAHQTDSEEAKEKLENNLKKLQGLWLDAILDDFEKNEYSDGVYENVNPYVRAFFSGLVEEFLDGIRAIPQYPTDPGWDWELGKSMQDLMELYPEIMQEEVLEDMDSFSMANSEWKEERLKAMEEFSWKESFVQILTPYLHQMKLFDDIFKGDFSGIAEEKKPEEKQEKKPEEQPHNAGKDCNETEGGFMVFSDSETNLPFS